MTIGNYALYNKCELCDGSGKIPEDLASLGICICNGSGFILSGLSTSQVDMFIARNNELLAEVATLKGRVAQLEEREREIEKVCTTQRELAEQLISIAPQSLTDEYYRIGVMAVTTRIADLYVRS